MKRRQTQIVLLAGAVAILIWCWLYRPRPSSPQPAPEQTQTAGAEALTVTHQGTFSSNAENPTTTQAATPNPTPGINAEIEQKKREMQAYTSLWRTPLLYYGKVVDESNQPIPGVRVSYGGNSVNESLTEETYNSGVTSTDPRGIFKIDGIRGIGLMFQLSHPNYYSYADNSTGFDVRSPPKDGIIPNTEEAARVFRMHHKGNPTALIERRGGLHKTADGTTMEFPLRGKTRAEIIGQLQVQGWKGEPDSQSGHFDWKVKITMPTGGVLESTNEFAFVAPETGYQQTLEISESKDDPNWKASADKALFFKMPNCFARGQANVDLFHDLYFSMQYFVNPDGSANLENDPSQPFQEP